MDNTLLLLLSGGHRTPGTYPQLAELSTLYESRRFYPQANVGDPITAAAGAEYLTNDAVDWTSVQGEWLSTSRWMRIRGLSNAGHGLSATHTVTTGTIDYDFIIWNIDQVAGAACNPDESSMLNPDGSQAYNPI